MKNINWSWQFTRPLRWYRRFKVLFVTGDASANGLSKKLEKYLPRRGGFFIEAGGNDGYKESNTLYFELKKSWKGILVEPVPTLFKKCKKLRKHSVVFNCALVDKEFSEDFVEMECCDLMSTVKGATSERYETMRNSIYPDHQAEKVKVEARTLESLIQQVGVKEIDLLSLDVEGFEKAALNGLNISTIQPKFILVEIWDAEVKMDGILDELGGLYEMIEQFTGHDYLFRLKIQ